MSQITRPVGTDAVVVVDATSGNESVSLTRLASGRTVTVRRTDSSANVVTVVVTSGLYLNGVLNGTATLPKDSELEFVAVDAGWESFGSGTDLTGTYAALAHTSGASFDAGNFTAIAT